MGYLPSALYVLRNIPKILPNNTGDTLQINFSQNDDKAW